MEGTSSLSESIFDLKLRVSLSITGINSTKVVACPIIGFFSKGAYH